MRVFIWLLFLSLLSLVLPVGQVLAAEGKVSVFNKSYTLGDLAVTATGGELTIAPVSVAKESYLPSKGEKLLVLYFTLKNTGMQAVKPAEALKVSVLCDNKQSSAQCSPWGSVGMKGKENLQLETLAAGKSAEAFTVITIAGDAVPGEMTLAGAEGNTLVYNLDKGIDSLIVPYGDADDKSGGMVLQWKINAILGKNYFTDEFVTIVSKVEKMDEFGEEASTDEEDLFVLSFSTRNLALSECPFTGPSKLTMTLDSKEKVNRLPGLYAADGKKLEKALVAVGKDFDGCFCFKVPTNSVPDALTWECEKTGVRLTFTGLQTAADAADVEKQTNPKKKKPEPIKTTKRKNSALGRTNSLVNEKFNRFVQGIFQRLDWKIDEAIDNAIDRLIK